jgi:hypothetical protein
MRARTRNTDEEKLDTLVADHIAHRLLLPSRLEKILSSVLERREDRAERRTTHIAELRKRRPRQTPNSSVSTTPSKMASRITPT